MATYGIFLTWWYPTSLEHRDEEKIQIEMLVLALMDMGNALWQTSTIRWRNSNLHEPKNIWNCINLRWVWVIMHHHQNQQKEAAKKKTSPADQLRLTPGPTIPPPRCRCFFLRAFIPTIPLPETNSKSPWKWRPPAKNQISIGNHHFQGRLLLLVSGRS